MLNQYFYHAKFRKIVAMFGSIFNEINIVRKDASSNVISQVKVPLSYAPKRKFLERLRDNPDLDNDTKVAVKLPRMSFEIVSFGYDPIRQIPIVNSFSQPGTDGNSKKRIYTSTPYSIQFQLHVYTKTQDDAMQVVEQILPYFGPKYTMAIKPFADYDILEDVPITLQAVTFGDDYEGMLENRRTIIYTFDFELKSSFDGPITDTQIIRKPIVEFGLQLTDSDSVIDTLTITPDPVGVSPDSDFGFTEVWT